MSHSLNQFRCNKTLNLETQKMNSKDVIDDFVTKNQSL